MSYCTKCGKPLDQTAKFCRFCGEPVKRPAVAPTPAAPNIAPEPVRTPTPPAVPAKKHTLAIILSVAGALALIGAAVAVWLIFFNKPAKPTPSGIGATASTSSVSATSKPSASAESTATTETSATTTTPESTATAESTATTETSATTTTPESSVSAESSATASTSEPDGDYGDGFETDGFAGDRMSAEQLASITDWNADLTMYSLDGENLDGSYTAISFSVKLTRNAERFTLEFTPTSGNYLSGREVKSGDPVLYADADFDGEKLSFTLPLEPDLRVETDLWYSGGGYGYSYFEPELNGAKYYAAFLIYENPQR